MRLWPLILLLAVATRLPAFQDRFYSNDEATYSALAARVAEGGAMYTDAIDHKPPGIVTVYAAVFSAFGPYRLAAVRGLLVVVVALTGIAVGELALLVTGDPRAGIAGVLYVLASSTGFPDNVQPANTELFLNLPLTLAAIAMATALRAQTVRRVWLLATLAGALTGLAGLFKYQAALAGLAWVATLWAMRARPRAALVAAAGLALGFGALAAALVGRFALSGHLDAFLFWGWRYNFSYIASMPPARQAARALVRTAAMAMFWAPLVVLALRGARARGERRSAPFIVWLWCAAMALAVSTGGRYFGNYYLMMLPPLAVLAARRRVPRLALAAAGALAVVSLAAALFWPSLRPDLAGEDARYRLAGSWIREHSSPGERLFVWGDSAQLYAYSKRLMGTRFAFTNYHTGKIWGTGADEPNAPHRPDLIVPRAWDELLADFNHAPPSIIVDAAAGGLHGFAGHGIEQYPPLWAILAREYSRVATISGMPVYRFTGESVTKRIAASQRR